MPSSDDLPPSPVLPDISARAQWNDLAVQQLVRYEALFKLLDDIQVQEDIGLIADRIATQWKYFAKVTSWRMLIAADDDFKVIDAHRGQAEVNDVVHLSLWDAHYLQLGLPKRISLPAPAQDPQPPAHLQGNNVVEIQVLPFWVAGRCIALLSAATRHEPFSELDLRFICLFGRYFADRIVTLMLQQKAMAALLSRATHDALTGLMNRGAIIDQLSMKLASAKRSQQPLSIILCDIDFFKAINDQYGHLTGDDVLVEVAARLRTQVRDCECLGRYGGEEFLLVLFPCGVEEAALVAERMRLAIAEQPFATYNGEQIAINISLGICSVAKVTHLHLERFLKCADDALYQSKEGGRNRITHGILPSGN